jgi:hypothetical protein
MTTSIRTPLQTALADPSPAQSRPRLRLHHLLALTAVMALMLAISGPRDVSSLEIPRILDVAFVAWGVVYTILASVAITIVLYGIAWRRQGILFFNEPGHWLLVAIAASQLVILIAMLVAQILALFLAYDVLPMLPAMLFWLLHSVPLLVLNLYIGRKKCSENHWSRVFYSKAAAAMVPAIGDLLVLLFLDRAIRAEKPRRTSLQRWNKRRGRVSPIVADYRPRRSRDAAHWCGVVVQFALAGLQLVMFATLFIWMYFAFFSS